jgi:Phosphopantetheine attachment site
VSWHAALGLAKSASDLAFPDRRTLIAALQFEAALQCACVAGAVELRNSVSAAFQLELPATATFDHPTIAALAAFIATKTISAEPDQAAAGHVVEVHSAAPPASAILARLQVLPCLQICMNRHYALDDRFCFSDKHKMYQCRPRRTGGHAAICLCKSNAQPGDELGCRWLCRRLSTSWSALRSRRISRSWRLG